MFYDLIGEILKIKLSIIYETKGAAVVKRKSELSIDVPMQ